MTMSHFVKTSPDKMKLLWQANSNGTNINFDLNNDVLAQRLDSMQRLLVHIIIQGKINLCIESKRCTKT